MKLPPVLCPVSFLSSAVATALLLLSTVSDSRACLQGYRFPPEKLRAPPAEPLRIRPKEAVKFDPPKIEPVKLEDLFGPAPSQAQPPQPADAAVAAGKIEREREESPEEFARYVQTFEQRSSLEPASFDDQTDYAVALVHLGRVPAAIKVLLALEDEHPGVYATAANLGTAYELNGELDAALKWISRGIELNPQSHEGTEWLHVAILRAKINLKTDAAWLARHSVLEGNEARPALEVARAIEYQLNERLHFVKPVDAVVCDLFYQAALLITGQDSREKRSELLRESLRFGEWRRAEVQALLKT